MALPRARRWFAADSPFAFYFYGDGRPNWGGPGPKCYLLLVDVFARTDLDVVRTGSNSSEFFCLADYHPPKDYRPSEPSGSNYTPSPYDQERFELLNGRPNETGTMSGFISYVVRDRALVTSNVDQSRPSVFSPPPPPPPPSLSLIERVFFPSRVKHQLLSQREASTAEAYGRTVARARECHEAEAREVKMKLAEEQAAKQAAYSGPYDQCRLLFPYRSVGIDENAATPLWLSMGGIIWYLDPSALFKTLHSRHPDEVERLSLRGEYFETYLYRRFVYVVEANTLQVPDITMLLRDSYDADARAIMRLMAVQDSSDAKRVRSPISEEVRIAVWRRDQGQCVKCGSREKLEFDHIIPVSKGGSSTERNIQLLCEHCNRSKSANIA